MNTWPWEQELIKEREQPELAWVYYHVVTRHYSTAMRLLRTRGGHGGAGGVSGFASPEHDDGGYGLGIDGASSKELGGTRKPCSSAGGQAAVPILAGGTRPAAGADGGHGDAAVRRKSIAGLVNPSST